MGILRSVDGQATAPGSFFTKTATPPFYKGLNQPDSLSIRLVVCACIKL
jgi:hypothetical protein